MKIRMLQSVAGAIDGHWSPKEGDELEVSDPAGALLCDRGFAEPIAEKASDRAEKRPAKKASESR